MKNLLFYSAFTIIGFSANAQAKIYDFPFNRALSATVGTGAFTSMLGTNYVTDRNSVSFNALVLNNTLTNESTMSGLPSGATRRTVALWFNRQGPGDVGLFRYGNNAPLELFGIYFNTVGHLVFQGYGAGNDTLLPISSGVPYNKWHHLAVMYTGTHVKVYFNGSLTNYIPRVLNTGSGNFSLGNMNGYYDDLKIYNDTLSEVQLTELFSSNEVTSTTTSIRTTTLKTDIATYPNPAQNTVSIANLPKEGNIKMVSILGSVLMETKINAATMDIDLSNYTNGLYFLHISDKQNATAIKKLMINK